MYVAFIDFKKAFDLVDRNYLWIIVRKNGIRGRMYGAIKSIVVKAIVRVNGDVTEAFLCPRRLKQGKNCSPVFFYLFINELANEVAEKDKYGITV